MPSSSGAVDLGSLSQETQDRLADKAEATGANPGALEVQTAFVVIVHRDGQVQVATYDGPSVVPDREFSQDDLYGAAATVQKDILASETAQATLAYQMQQAQAIQQQMEAQRIRQSLDLNHG